MPGKQRSLLRLYKLGMVMFGLQALYMSVAFYHAYSLELQFIAIVGSEQYTSVDWAKLFLFPVFFVVPIILLSLTFYKLYLPEKSMKSLDNASSWNFTFAVLGFFFGLIVGALPFAVARDRIKAAEWERKWDSSSRYFSQEK